MHCRSLLVVLLSAGFVLSAGFGAPEGADRIRLAQSGSTLNKISRDRHIIRAQLKLGITYEQRALEALLSPTSPELVAEQRRMIKEGYVQIRLAWHGVRERLGASESRGEAGLTPAVKYLDQAMAHVRAADSAVAAAGGNAQELARAMENLEAAIALARRALVLI